jgi:hypothetical protein
LCIHTLGIKILTNGKKSFQKDFWKQGAISTLQKLITTIWLKFQEKKITFNLMISFFNPCLVIINILE